MWDNLTRHLTPMLLLRQTREFKCHLHRAKTKECPTGATRNPSVKTDQKLDRKSHPEPLGEGFGEGLGEGFGEGFGEGRHEGAGDGRT